jgi:glycosyltransferase involved in cell wall biosynthesis
VYNGERFLGEALDSLLAQSCPDFELIVSDNASTDRTEAICRGYATQDRRVRYYRNKQNRGAACNYRRVFELSTAEYFKWATSDDLCEPEHLARCAAALDSDPSVVLVYPKTRFIDETGAILDVHDPGWNLQYEAAHERLRYVLFSGHWVNAIYGLMRAEALSRTRLLASYPGGDYRVLTELSLLGKFVELSDCFFLRRLHRGASSQNTNSLEWQVTFYRGNSRRLALPVWQRTLDDITTILRARLALCAKASLLRSLLRRMRWQRRCLLDELKVASWYCLRRVIPATSYQCSP